MGHGTIHQAQHRRQRGASSNRLLHLGEQGIPQARFSVKGVPVAQFVDPNVQRAGIECWAETCH
jgi:hypothetical protein